MAQSVFVSKPTGLFWSLYPLFAIVAFLEFILGFAHLALCYPFFPYLLPILSGSLALITACHAFFLPCPDRVDFILECCCAVIGSALTATSGLEMICGVDFDNRLNENKTMFGVCYGVSYRTTSHRHSCVDFLNNFHGILNSELGIYMRSHSFQMAVSTTLFALAVTQTCLAAVLSFYSSMINRLDIRSFHIEMVIAFLLMPLSYIHHNYCSTYFFLYPGYFVAAFAIIHAMLSWKPFFEADVLRLLSLLGAAIGMALTAMNSFAVFCTSSRTYGGDVSFQWHCRWPPSKYRYCYRKIEFREPYRSWSIVHVMAEVATVQICDGVALCIAGIVYCIISLKSAFRSKQKSRRYL